MVLKTSYQRLGQAYLGKSGGSLYVRVYARYSEQDIANNRSYVYLQARAYYENGTYITDKQASGNVSGAGLTKKSGSLSTIYTGETTIATTEGWVYHNSDGKKSISASGYLNFPNWGWSATASGSAELPTIPRHASITAAPNFTDEENPTINYSNPAGDAITSIKACIANASGTVVYAAYRDIPKNGTSYTFELTEEEREALRWATINSNTLTVKFYVTSVIGGTTKESTLNKILTIANATPDLTVSAKDTGGFSTPLTGNENKIIKGFNYVNVSMSSVLKKGANIKSQTITNGSQVINGSSGGFENTENNIFTFSLTDSRGNTVNKNLTLDMIDYVKLTCNLNAKNPTPDGNMTFDVSGNYFNGNFGATDNTLVVYFRYKENDGDYGEWIEANPTPTISGNTYETTVNLTGLNYRSSYTFQAKAADKLATILSSEKKVKTIPAYDWGENDFQFNVDIYDKFNQLINNGLAEYDGGNIDVNETLSFLCLAQYNTPNNSLYYVMTFFYGTKSVTTNRTQLAIPYIYDISQKKNNIFVRQYVNGQWNEWATTGTEKYSTEEQIVGIWKSDKPIYQKTIETTTTTTDTRVSLTSLGVNNAEDIWIDLSNSYARYQINGNFLYGSSYQPISIYLASNDYKFIYIDANSNLTFRNGKTETIKWVVTLKYTKKTD